MVVEHTFKHVVLVKRAWELVEGEKKKKAAGDAASISKSSLALPMCQEDKNAMVSKCSASECQETVVS